MKDFNEKSKCICGKIENNRNCPYHFPITCHKPSVEVSSCCGSKVKAYIDNDLNDVFICEKCDSECEVEPQSIPLDREDRECEHEYTICTTNPDIPEGEANQGRKYCNNVCNYKGRGFKTVVKKSK